MLREVSPAQLDQQSLPCMVTRGLLLCLDVWDTAGPDLTFGQCDLSDAVALSKPHRHGADQVSRNLLLSVLSGAGPRQGCCLRETKCLLNRRC